MRYNTGKSRTFGSDGWNSSGPLPIDDKQQRNEYIRRVLDFLRDEGYDQPLQLKDMQIIGFALYLSILGFIVRKFDPCISVTRHNYDEILCQSLKMTNYPGRMSSSTAKSFSSASTWAKILHALVYLISILEVEKRLDSAVALIPTCSPSLDLSNAIAVLEQSELLKESSEALSRDAEVIGIQVTPDMRNDWEIAAKTEVRFCSDAARTERLTGSTSIASLKEIEDSLHWHELEIRRAMMRKAAIAEEFADAQTNRAGFRRVRTEVENLTLKIGESDREIEQQRARMGEIAEETRELQTTCESLEARQGEILEQLERYKASWDVLESNQQSIREVEAEVAEGRRRRDTIRAECDKLANAIRAQQPGLDSRIRKYNEFVSRVMPTGEWSIPEASNPEGLIACVSRGAEPSTNTLLGLDLCELDDAIGGAVQQNNEIQVSLHSSVEDLKSKLGKAQRCMRDKTEALHQMAETRRQRTDELNELRKSAKQERRNNCSTMRQVHDEENIDALRESLAALEREVEFKRSSIHYMTAEVARNMEAATDQVKQAVNSMISAMKGDARALECFSQDLGDHAADMVSVDVRFVEGVRHHSAS